MSKTCCRIPAQTEGGGKIFYQPDDADDFDEEDPDDDLDIWGVFGLWKYIVDCNAKRLWYRYSYKVNQTDHWTPKTRIFSEQKEERTSWFFPSRHWGVKCWCIGCLILVKATPVSCTWKVSFGFFFRGEVISNATKNVLNRLRGYRGYWTCRCNIVSIPSCNYVPTSLYLHQKWHCPAREHQLKMWMSSKVLLISWNLIVFVLRMSLYKRSSECLLDPVGSSQGDTTWKVSPESIRGASALLSELHWHCHIMTRKS